MNKPNVPTDLIGGKDAVNASMAAATAGRVLQPLENYLVDMTTDVAQPHYRLRIAGVDMLAASDLCVICGAPKQGKTHFLLSIAATILSGRNFGTMTRGEAVKKCLWIDTEQSRYYIQQGMKRLLSLCGQPEHTDMSALGMPVYSLRACSTAAERIEFIAEAIEKHDPEILFIDQIRDLLDNFNDESQSIKLTSWLLKILDTRPYLTIVTVLHTNWGTDKMRGHLGSEMHTKISEKFNCKKENNVFSVTHEGRGKELQQPFQFYIDSDGKLAVCGADMAAGVVNPEAALLTAIGDGCYWDKLIDNYKKAAKVTEKQAKQVIKQKYERGEIISAGGLPVVYVLNPDIYPKK